MQCMRRLRTKIQDKGICFHLETKVTVPDPRIVFARVNIGVY